LSAARYASDDPRTIITPDAFSVASNLVGLPLATPARRLVAISIDLIFVAAFSFLGWYLLGITVVVGAFRAATRKTEEGTSQIFRAFRVILGCFGTFVLLIVVLAVGSIFFFDTGDLPTLDDVSFDPSGVGGEGDGTNMSLGDLARGAISAATLTSADNPEDAATSVAGLATALLEAGMTRAQVREAASEWRADDVPEWWDDALEAGLQEAFLAAGSEDAAARTLPAGEPVARSLDEALEAYAALVRQGEVPNSPEEAALRSQIVADLGADTIAGLSGALEESRQDLRSTEARLQTTREALEAEEGSGFFAAIGSIAESTGLLFGWGTVYMSLFTAWWNGQTIGKKLLGIRVVRLDGKPMSGWMAFERAGGYAAGFATGLIGFAQIHWDPNRMAIHDKVTETAVIRDGALPVPGPWNTPRSAPGSDG